MTEPSEDRPGDQVRPNADIAREQRRKLLRGGVGAAPILMTLASRPVLGQVQQCTTPSGFVSMPTSRPPQTTCIGRTPGFWKQPQKFDQWPAPYVPVTTSGPGGKKATTFNSVFGTPSPYTNTTTFLDV